MIPFILSGIGCALFSVEEGFEMTSSQFLVLFLSKFFSKRLPEKKEIQKNVLSFSYKSDTKNVIFTINALIFNLFNYTRGKKSIDEENIYTRIFNIPQLDKYLFLYVNKKQKKLFILPLILKDFLIFKINKDEFERVEKIIPELTNYELEKVESEDAEDIYDYLAEQVKPSLKGKIDKEAIVLIIFTSIAILLLVTIFIFNKQIIDFFLTPNSTILTGIIVGIVGGTIVGLFLKGPKIWNYLLGIIKKE